MFKMSIDVLAARAKVLQGVVQQASQNVNSLSQQLQQATVHMHTVNGHLNEVAFLLGEAQKEAGLVPSEAPPAPEPCKEQEDGKANEQTEVETPEE